MERCIKDACPTELSFSANSLAYFLKLVSEGLNVLSNIHHSVALSKIVSVELRHCGKCNKLG